MNKGLQWGEQLITPFTKTPCLEYEFQDLWHTTEKHLQDCISDLI